MSSEHNLQNLFNSMQRARHILLEVRLVALPQPKLFMLLERIGEIGLALEQSLRAPDSGQDKGASEALLPLFKLLASMQASVLADLKRMETIVRYDDLPSELADLKDRLRNLSARILGELEGHSPAEVVEKNGRTLKETIDTLEALQVKLRAMEAEALPKIEGYCRTLGDIFTLLETGKHSARVFNLVTDALDRIAHEKVAASGMFDEEFYRNQLPDEMRDTDDPIRQYLRQNENFAPFPCFDDRFYRASNIEIDLLRYNPLEHFVRYGMILRRDPGPKFDTRYYLASNEDVLDANAQPIRHFVRYGMREGRLPFAMVEGINRRRRSTTLCLAFVGDPDAGVRGIWNMLRAECEARTGGRILDIPPDSWTGKEDGLDALVVSGNGASRLRGAQLRALGGSGVRLLYLGDTPLDDLKPLLKQDAIPLERIGAVTTDAAAHLSWQESRAPIRLYYYDFDAPEGANPLVKALLSVLKRDEYFPLRRDNNWCAVPDGRTCISVVHPLTNGPTELPVLLEALNRQDLARPYEVVLVEIASSDSRAEMAEHWIEERRKNGLLNRFMTVRILRDADRHSNDSARDLGIRNIRADVVFTVSGGVLPGSTCLSEHLWSHRYPDCHAAVGHARREVNINTAFGQMAACEVSLNPVPISIPPANDLGMRPLPNGIFNDAPHTLSFRKDALENFFDDSLSVSSKENYGEEDHGMRAKLYYNRKNLRFLEGAISVRLRHREVARDIDWTLAALRNWNRLLDLFPDLALVDRPYYQWRTGQLLSAASSMPDAPEYRHARDQFEAPSRANVTIRSKKQLKILTFKWHASHQYELFKANHLFTLATNIGTPHCNRWDYGTRPKPHNVKFLPLESIEPREYDFAILPFDEHILNPGHCAALSPDWGNAFLTMLELTKDIPRIALCHGTPQIYEGESMNSSHAQGKVISSSREALRSLLGNIHVVCNSYQAQQEWAFAKSSVIWHGFSPTEFPPGKHNRGCLTLPRQAFESRPVYRGKAIRQSVEQLLGDRCFFEYTAPPEPHPGYTPNSQEYAVAKFENYVKYIGKYTMYFNPTVYSPMPRSRDEAMMTGTIPVSLRNHDVHMFIQNGINGFYGDSAEELAEQIKWVTKHEKEKRELSKNARLTSMDIFHIDRYLSAWSDLILKIK